MLYAGIDYHKRYSQVHVMTNAGGPVLQRGWRMTSGQCRDSSRIWLNHARRSLKHVGPGA